MTTLLLKFILVKVSIYSTRRDRTKTKKRNEFPIIILRRYCASMQLAGSGQETGHWEENKLRAQLVVQCIGWHVCGSTTLYTCHCASERGSSLTRCSFHVPYVITTVREGPSGTASIANQIRSRNCLKVDIIL